MYATIKKVEIHDEEIKAKKYLRWLEKKLIIVIFCAYLLLLYTSVPLDLSPILARSYSVPTFWVLPILVIYILLFGVRLYKTDVYFVIKLTVIILISILFSLGFEYYPSKLTSALMMLMAVINGIILLQLTERIDQRTIGTILLGFTLFIIAGTALELLGPLKDISDTFRSWAFRTAYQDFDPAYAQERDYALVGFVRPSLFTSETSNLTKGFLLFSNAWLLVGYKRTKAVVLMAANLFMLLSTGSLVIVASLTILLVIMMFLERKIKYIFIIFIAIIGLALIAWFIKGEEISLIIDRLRALENVSEETASIRSVLIRLVYPYITTADVLKANMLFGTGIGGDEVVSKYSSLTIPLEFAIGNNGLANYVMSFGIVGIILFIVSISSYLKKKRIHNKLLFFFIMIMLLQTMGDAWTIRVWAYAFLLMSVMKNNNSKYVIN